MNWISLRQRLLGGESGSVGGRLRQERARWLAETFPDLTEMSVIDLGGRILTWQRAPVRPKHVHVVNVQPSEDDIPEWAEFDLGDACALPAHVAGRHYDLVFSNSLIEHVGGHQRRERFADTVHQLSGAYWVQTPYRYFPIEPHWMAPGAQFLPVAVRAQVVRRWPLSYRRGQPREAALRTALSIELLDRAQLRYYFPDSLIRTEMVFGIPKSLIACRTGDDSRNPCGKAAAV
jgi:hypothetical protein